MDYTKCWRNVYHKTALLHCWKDNSFFVTMMEDNLTFSPKPLFTLMAQEFHNSIYTQEKLSYMCNERLVQERL